MGGEWQAVPSWGVSGGPWGGPPGPWNGPGGPPGPWNGPGGPPGPWNGPGGPPGPWNGPGGPPGPWGGPGMGMMPPWMMGGMGCPPPWMMGPGGPPGAWGRSCGPWDGKGSELSNSRQGGNTSPLRERALQQHALSHSIQDGRGWWGSYHPNYNMGMGDSTMVNLQTEEANALRRKDETQTMEQHVTYDGCQSPTKLNHGEIRLGVDSHAISNDGLYQSELCDDGDDVDNTTRLNNNLKDCVGDLVILEDKRKNLSMRFDFCLTESFSQFDVNKTGYVGLNDFDVYAKKSGIALTREDWAILIDRYDKDRDGYLSFSEFIEIFAPYTKNYRDTMTQRSTTNVEKFFDYTVQTKKLLKDLLYSCVTCEENFEHAKYKVTKGIVAVSNELFDLLDTDKDGYVSVSEFGDYLKAHAIKASAQNVRLLFDQFDKNKDGKISFGEFHRPTKNDAYNYYGVQA